MKYFIGEHDFRNFTKINKSKEKQSFIRKILTFQLNKSTDLNLKA
jgi:tRNA U38,U39,U40 pseudouridine synthase TruA